MVKKLQALKAKKGFTLVELIVVIAIIGVLAAILVPTMLGMVTKSRVTSVNSTAASFLSNIDSFLTDADTNGYGMLKGSSNTSAMTFSVNDKGEWTVTVSNHDKAFKTGGTKKWVAATTSTVTKDTAKTDAKDATTLLAIEMANLFPTMKSSFIWVYAVGGDGQYCYYTADAVTAPTGAPTVEDFKAESCKWDGNTAGIASSGEIIGTAPALQLGEGGKATP